MQKFTCSRDMSEEFHRIALAEDCLRERYIYDARSYDPARMCNALWMGATSLYWAVAKIEALGDIGAEYVVEVAS